MHSRSSTDYHCMKTEVLDVSPMVSPNRYAQAEPVHCAHCGLLVPSSRYNPNTEHQFCCSGCQTVYEVIQANGFEAYYTLRDQTPKQPAKLVAEYFEEFDDPTFIDTTSTPISGGLLSTNLYLEGVHCSACIWLVEKSLTTLTGVGESRLNYRRSQLRLCWDPKQIKLSAVAQHLARLGYTPHAALDSANDGQQREMHRLIIRMGVAGAVAGNVMLMAFALYGGWWSGMDEQYRVFFQYMSLLVSLPAVVYSAWPFYRGAWNGLKGGVLHMDLPITIGILAGFFGGVLNTIDGEGEVYFDTVTALIFLLLVGRILQLRQQQRAADSSELLYALTPSFACRFQDDGSVQRISPHTIQVGDKILVEPGDLIATDGYIEQGASSIDMSLLSGESEPITVNEGELVWGGTKNLSHRLVFLATQTVKNSRAGQISDLVEVAGAYKAPVVQLADQIASWFVGAVLTLSALTYIFWLSIDASLALDHSIALLIVSCPCALGLATPLAITAAMAKAARRGILIRSGGALEALGGMKQGTVFFDKTGTLTMGKMSISEYIGSDWVHAYVAAAEQGSEHPVGRALQANRGGRPLPEVDEVEVYQGGLIAQFGHKTVAIGCPEFVTTRAEPTSAITSCVGPWSRGGLTPVYVAFDRQIVAAYGLLDIARPDAKTSVDYLRMLGFEVGILSGDHPNVVKAIGQNIGLPAEVCIGGLLPEDKLARVRAKASEVDLVQQGDINLRGCWSRSQSLPVIMVGDGVNDAAALKAAHVGIAVHGGTEACFKAADVSIQAEGLQPLLELIGGAKNTYAVIKGGILFSLAYNLIGAGLAMTGALTPLVAAVLMPVSSLIVLSNAFWVRFEK